MNPKGIGAIFGIIGARIYYVIFKSIDINIVFVGILAFGINSGAYVSEIIRAGIQSIPVGQMEAGYSLGLKYNQVMSYIVLPQAIRNVLPALVNEFITLVKETSVGAYIGIIELTKASDIIASRTYDYFFPLVVVAIIYLIITLICLIEGEEIWKPSKRLTVFLCILLVFSLITTILIPSRDTMIYMAALSFVTPDNVEYGTEIVKNVFDYIVNALDTKTNTTE